MKPLKKLVKCPSGHRCYATYMRDEAGIMLLLRGWLSYRDIPESPDDYRYTHGGCCYQAACELAWAIKQEIPYL